MMRSKIFLVLLTVAASIVFSHWPTVSHAGPPASSWLNKTKARVVLPPSKSWSVPAPAVSGWSYCADAYQALADAVAHVGREPVATYSQKIDITSSDRMFLDCYPVNATADLQRAAFRGFAGFARDNKLRSCWNSAHELESEWQLCPHPQYTADDIAYSEARMDGFGWTDERVVDENDPLNVGVNRLGVSKREAGIGGAGFQISYSPTTPYFLVMDDARSLGLIEAVSIRFLRSNIPFVQTRAVYDNYYKEGASSPQAVICVNREIASLAAACRDAR